MMPIVTMHASKISQCSNCGSRRLLEKISLLPSSHVLRARCLCHAVKAEQRTYAPLLYVMSIYVGCMCCGVLLIVVHRIRGDLQRSSSHATWALVWRLGKETEQVLSHTVAASVRMLMSVQVS
jgi:hypothetical protein